MKSVIKLHFVVFMLFCYVLFQLTVVMVTFKLTLYISNIKVLLFVGGKEKMKKKNFLKEAGVLLIAVIMVLSTTMVIGSSINDTSKGLEGGLKLPQYRWSIADKGSDTWNITDSPNPVGPCANPVYVDDGYYNGGTNDGHTWGTDAFDNIQDGVNAVDDPGTVYVYEGYYSAGIVINKELEVIGEDGADKTFIDGYFHAGDTYGVEINQKTKFSGFTIRLYYDKELSTTTLGFTYEF